VHVSDEDGGDIHLGPITVARVIARIVGNDITDIKFFGRNKVTVNLKNLSAANRIFDRPLFTENGLTVSISIFRIMRTGVKNVFLDVFENDILRQFLL